MDPVSGALAAAGLTSILIKAVGISISITSGLRALKDCPRSVTELASELYTFAQTLQTLQQSSQSLAITEQLETAKIVIEDIEKLLKHYVDASSQKRTRMISRVKWVKDNEAAMQLRQRLGVVRANIVLLLSTA